MKNIAPASTPAGPNSVTNRYKALSKRERLLVNVSRSIRKIGHKTGIENPIEDFLKEYNETTWHDCKTLDELDEVTLEWLNNMFADSIHQLCEKIKKDSQDVLELQQ